MSQPPWRFNRGTWQMVERPGFEMECVTVPLGNLLTFNVYPPAVPPGTSVANHPVLRWNVTVPHLFLGFTVICYLQVPAWWLVEKQAGFHLGSEAHLEGIENLRPPATFWHRRATSAIAQAANMPSRLFLK